mmetsp:Transcript_56783/g.112779  ORF Transcript_56783/g.112779 Transcript_56783/m.112779 type:complete len:236 (-) Transcript_56783:1667-2374(-)
MAPCVPLAAPADVPERSWRALSIVRACTRARCCSRFQRFRTAWSVLDGRRAATAHQRGPSSCTARTMIWSSCGDQETRGLSPSSSAMRLFDAFSAGRFFDGTASRPSPCLLEVEPARPPVVMPLLLLSSMLSLEAALAPMSPPPLRMAAAFASSCSRFHRLRTESSERPGSSGAISRQRMPIRSTHAEMVASSSVDQARLLIDERREEPRRAHEASASAWIRREAAEAAAAAAAT